MRIVRLRDRRQGKVGDRARPENEAVSRPAELEVTEFLALGYVAAGLDFRVYQAGRHLAHAYRHESHQADDGVIGLDEEDRPRRDMRQIRLRIPGLDRGG